VAVLIGRHFSRLSEKRVKAVSFGLLAFALTLSSSASPAADAPPGATACSGCHALSAAAETPVPKIRGRPAAETIAAMADFRSGKKPSTVMDRIAKGFTEDETKAIAAWLAAQR